MQFYVPSDKAAPLLRPTLFKAGSSVAVVNQTTTDVYMSDNPAELDASATGLPSAGGIRVAANGGQVLWPSSITTAWFRAILAWVALANHLFGDTIIDKLGGLWKVTTPAAGGAAAASGAAYPFPATVQPVGTTQADGAVTWTYQGPASIALNVQPG